VLAPILYRKSIYPGLKAGAINIKSPSVSFKNDFPVVIVNEVWKKANNQEWSF
jgi:hypothetical protein